MTDYLSDVFDYIRGCAKRQALQNLSTAKYKTEYKTLAKGAISALIYLKILREDDIEMLLNEFDRVCEKETKRIQECGK